MYPKNTSSINQLNWQLKAGDLDDCTNYRNDKGLMLDLDLVPKLFS